VTWSFGWLRRLFGPGRDQPPPEDAERLSALFTERYQAFKQLLAANSKALATMAEMEQAALGRSAYGMPFVRAACTRAGVSVFRMVRHLDVLAPGKYAELFARLEEIRGEIQQVVGAGRSRAGEYLVASLTEVHAGHVGRIGAKMANLGEARVAVGARIPDGFVLSADAFDVLLRHTNLDQEIFRQLQATEIDGTDELFALSSRLQQLIIGTEVPEELAHVIDSALRALLTVTRGQLRLAVRSSALGEDSAEASFAGQYRSQLNVRSENMLDAYLDVVASKYTPQAMHYRLLRGLRDIDVAMAVGCLVMVDARVSGVAYTADPRDRLVDDVVVNATWGLPKTIVDGRFGNDIYVVHRGEPLAIAARTVGIKDSIFVCDPDEGVMRQEVGPDRSGVACLTDDQVFEVTRLALKLEAHYGLPQDIEWAIDADGELILLQCRPLLQVTAGSRREPPEDAGEPVVQGGVCASPGTACGPVHRVRNTPDALAMPDGAVLVLDHPLPQWAALLGRARAVVSEQGNIAGHLATVAREMLIPALLGVGPADALEQGRTVTVDADGLSVYEGEVGSLLDARADRANPMEGTPVHASLLDVLQLVSPLNLLDPDGVDFRPGNCSTLHDITRFCHEMSVREMFRFGKDHRFPRHASKQLHHNVPMQWWVLDLDDGFHHEVRGKYVRLSDIASRPMLAVWDGMVAVPWDGPPAMTGRGMASVLFQATANPALSSPFRKPYAQRNYFMISRTFMNLQSRFGFHFSSVETLVSERDNENYISFSFKGGAADLERRIARVRMLADILEHHGFSVRLTEDNASARLGGLDADATAARLRIIGYLIMHTRQLDMIMADPAAVRRYRSKLERDTASLLHDPDPDPVPDA
jgi:pyruvate,water dikinase